MYLYFIMMFLKLQRCTSSYVLEYCKAALLHVKEAENMSQSVNVCVCVYLSVCVILLRYYLVQLFPPFICIEDRGRRSYCCHTKREERDHSLFSFACLTWFVVHKVVMVFLFLRFIVNQKGPAR